jgi:bifunctional non-homologous end joining protein LigD
VLLSWAVPKGPSSDPREKRLAVRTEDHPIDYAGFEGTIPKGEYGAGTVMLWDEGTWSAQENFGQGLKKGKLKFTLQGSRMHGGWTLVRMQRKPDDKRENWLLIKEIDDDAGEEPDALTDQFDVSVRTGRPMKRIAAAVGPVASAAADRKRRGKRPAFTTPQLATLVDKPPEGDDWLHETKFDGYRCLAALGGGGTRLYTRSGKDWTDRFGRLATAFDALPCDTALIDGYFVEGHVPAEEVTRLLDERPQAAGLAVPGMPLGSPGMDFGDEEEVYAAYLVRAGGAVDTYATRGGTERSRR